MPGPGPAASTYGRPGQRLRRSTPGRGWTASASATAWTRRSSSSRQHASPTTRSGRSCCPTRQGSQVRADAVYGNPRCPFRRKAAKFGSRLPTRWQRSDEACRLGAWCEHDASLWQLGVCRRQKARRTPPAHLPGAGWSTSVHAEMAQLSLLPGVLVRLAGDGSGVPAPLACPGVLGVSAREAPRAGWLSRASELMPDS